ncbi:MAG: hypothetical protein ACI8UO_005075, partial [Verrucomicrobiales bacterium]
AAIDRSAMAFGGWKPPLQNPRRLCSRKCSRSLRNSRFHETGDSRGLSAPSRRSAQFQT